MPDLSLNPDIGTQRAPRVSPYPDASLYLDFLTMTASTFDSRITFSRGTNATLVDSTGRITYAPANLLVQSQNFTDAAWVSSNTPIRTAGQTDPNGGTTATKLDLDVNDGIYQFLGSRTGNFVFSIWVRGDAAGTIRLSDASGGAFDVVVNVTTAWTRVSTGSRAISGFFSPYIYRATGDLSTVYVAFAQLEPVTYQTTPSTYVATAASAYYGPRFDYDPVTLAARGLLIEEARTNTALYSADITNAVYIFSASSASANVTAAPDGTVTADKAVEDTTNATHRFYQLNVVTVTNPFSASVYLKAAERTFAYFGIGNGQYTRASVNLTTGATGALTGPQAANLTIRTVAAGNGWWRVIISGTFSVADSGHVWVTISDNGAESYLGNGTSGIYVWGYQGEAGAFATSYIPTVASTVTRNADVATMTGTNFSSWYNQSEGTFVYNATALAKNSSAGPWVVNVTAGANANSMYSAFADTRQLRVYDGSAVEQAAIASSAVTVLQYAKVASAYKLNDFAVSANGGTVATDTSGTLAAPTQMMIGSTNGSFNGWIAQIVYFNTRQPNSQLQTLTAPSLAPTLNLDFINNVYNVGF